MRVMNVVVMGSTGSIGQQALAVMRLHPDQYTVVGLAADKNWALLCEQCRMIRPRYVYLRDPEALIRLRDELGDQDIDILSYNDFISIIQTTMVDCVVAAVVGIAGLHSTYVAVGAGKTVLLANKESLVVAGSLIMREAKRSQARLLPIDSEHSALFQCLPQNLSCAHVKKLILTASGGPFWPTPFSQLSEMTVDQVCAHPRWAMGRKISVDSATMVNKGLEVIEAHWLFGIHPDKIDVVIHPESVIHSLVDYVDGSTLAQLAYPDMRTALSYALSHPRRMSSGVSNVDLLRVGRLSFHAFDVTLFPCFRLIREALLAGQGACIIANAANEVAVQSFLDGQLRFTDIFLIISETLDRVSPQSCDSLDDILSLNEEARACAMMLVSKRADLRVYSVSHLLEVF